MDLSLLGEAYNGAEANDCRKHEQHGSIPFCSIVMKQGLTTMSQICNHNLHCRDQSFQLVLHTRLVDPLSCLRPCMSPTQF